MKEIKYHAFVEKEDDLFIAHSVEYGISSQGVTEIESLAMLKEAVDLFLAKTEKDFKLSYEVIDSKSETAYLFKGKNGERLRNAINRVKD